MPRINIYGLRTSLEPVKTKMDEVVHKCVVSTLGYPKEKKIHKFVHVEKEDFYHPKGSNESYIIVELKTIFGKSLESKNRFTQMLFKEVKNHPLLSVMELDICMN